MIIVHSDEIMLIVNMIVIVLIIKGQAINHLIDKGDKSKDHNPKPYTTILTAVLI